MFVLSLIISMILFAVSVACAGILFAEIKEVVTTKLDVASACALISIGTCFLASVLVMFASFFYLGAIS